jgi:hypothetical protein
MCEHLVWLGMMMFGTWWKYDIELFGLPDLREGILVGLVLVIVCDSMVV